MRVCVYVCRNKKKKNSQPHTTSRHCLGEGPWKLRSVHSLAGQLAAALTCGCLHTSLSLRRQRCRLGKKLARQLSRNESLGQMSVSSGCPCLCTSIRPLVNVRVLDCVRPADLHVEPQQGSSLSSQELMTRLCFLLGDVTHGTDSTPMEDRSEKKVGQHIDSPSHPPAAPQPPPPHIHPGMNRSLVKQGSAFNLLRMVSGAGIRTAFV